MTTPLGNADAAAQLVVELRSTTERQARAADPSVSAWVSANAGTGKTHVLTTRVLRLLVAGTLPERLLCLTYTKAAAAEMSSRVFAQLAGWVTAEDDALRDALAKLLGRAPMPDELERSRDLFTRAIETPGGLKVQTIHAFCERLLQRFPLEAGVPPGFAILDEEMRATLIKEATERVLRAATGAPTSALGQALSTTIRFAADDSFDNVLGQALAKRDWLEEATRLALGNEDELTAAAELYRKALDLDPDESRDRLEDARSKALGDAPIARARDVLRGGTKTDVDAAEKLSAASSASTPRARLAALAAFFLTNEGGLRARLMTAKLKAAHPDLDAILTSAQARFHDLTQKLGRLAVADATLALLRLASAVMQHYTALKQQRAALDFDDLIRAAGNLLRTGADAQWVLYKLDGGLDHILVDEAQDTSPTQWRVVEALAREFYAGDGAREVETGGPRTVFAVGDEKQSIYGFQGAAPKMFAAVGASFEAMAKAASLAFTRVPLTLSFRTVAPVLEAVDGIFADPVRSAGLTSTGQYQRHAVSRLGMGGLIEIWDTEKADDTAAAPAWKPLAEIGGERPETRLADRIAETIDGWIRSGEQLASEGRPITCGDILILVRRRRPFADLMVRALKSRGIPVAGADRLRLADQLAVQDLMALCDVLLLPEDDLALAGALKSPLFGLDDTDLMAIAPERRGSLWSALLAAAPGHPRLEPAAEQLKRWRGRADVVPPYEFLVEVLVHDGMRRRLLGRLGPEAADPLDELVSLALSYDDQAPPSLQGFMDWLRAAEREIKRDMEHGRDEVRVMTVHGSKGLEAPIVFLPDTCSAPTGNKPGGLVGFEEMQLPEGAAEPFLWPVKGTAGIEAIKSARDAVKGKDAEEHNRLLYVALTRPRDRLYVAGFESSKGRDKASWYEAIETGLAGTLMDGVDGAGRRVRRMVAAQSVPAKARDGEAGALVEPLALPAWATTKAPREPGLAVPLAPSRLAPLDIDADGDPVEPPFRQREADEPPAPSPATLAGDNRFLRGTLTHALLQHLPGLSPDVRAAAADGYVGSRGADLSAAMRAGIVAETLEVLADPAFAPVFGPGSRAEVPIAARLQPPSGKGQAVHVTGQIDRLVATDHDILIVDFKTNRPPPTEVDAVPDAYVLQLAAYRAAVAQIFPGLAVRAALLWTDGPRLMELPSDRLDDAARRLFMLDQTSLDA